jgi:hypothetical protein
VPCNGRVMGRRQNLPPGIHHHRPHGNLPRPFGQAGLLKSETHVGFVSRKRHGSLILPYPEAQASL